MTDTTSHDTTNTTPPTPGTNQTDLSDLIGIPLPEQPPTPDHPHIDHDPTDNGLRGQRRLAHRFVTQHQNHYIHVPALGWHQWTGNHWQPCEADTEPWNDLLTTVDNMHHDLPHLTEHEQKNLKDDTKETNKTTGMTNILQYATRHPSITTSHTKLNNNPDLFVFKNGTIDLQTLEFRPSKPKDHNTHTAGCNYNPQATCPTFLHLLDQYQPDPKTREYLQMALGAALEGRQNLQQLHTWFGATGGNGKGTTMHAILNVFGDYARMFPVEGLTTKGPNDAYRDEKAQLQGKRLIFATEPDQRARFNAGTVKALTGGDTVTARAMYTKSIEFQPTWLIIMPTNNRVTTPTDGGMARRLKEIPWNFQLPENTPPRTDLDTILRSEASGIANWLLQGWNAYKTGLMDEPDTIKQATAQYLHESNPIAQFMEDNTTRTKTEKIASSDLYHRYKIWADDEGHACMSHKSFGDELTNLGYKRKKISKYYIMHVALKPMV